MEMTIITTMVSGIVIALVTSWFTVQLSLNRFRTEKHWERRAKAYERVIEALHDMKTFSDSYLKAASLGSSVAETRERQLHAKAIKAHQEIDRATDMASFLLGNEARERLKRYQKDYPGESTMSWEEFLVYDLKMTDSCLEDLIEIARRDLGFCGERGIFHFFK